MYSRAIIINPEKQEISEFYLEPTLEGMKYALRAMDPHFSGMVECVGIARGEDLWIDEEGCLSPGRAAFTFGPHTFAGACLILAHDDEGDSVSSKLPFDLIRALVKWTNLETTGEFGLGREYVADHPIFGKTPVIEGGKPIYQERV